MARALDAIGDWWSLLIIRDAFQGVRRFGEFERNLGVAKNILTARLRKLVAVGILEVAPASDGSKYQEYVLTKKGARPLPRHHRLEAVGGELLPRSETGSRARRSQEGPTRAPVGTPGEGWETVGSGGCADGGSKRYRVTLGLPTRREAACAHNSAWLLGRENAFLNQRLADENVAQER